MSLWTGTSGVGLSGHTTFLAEGAVLDALEFFLRGVWREKHEPAGSLALGTEGALPLARSLRWRWELRAARTFFLLDAGTDEVGEAVAPSKNGKATLLVCHRRNRRLDPYRGVRVGEAAHPGPGSSEPTNPKPPPKPPDHYAALNLRRGASAAEAKTAYRKKVLTEHPDKGGTEARFRRVEEAHRVLTDSHKRWEYDCAVGRWETWCRKGAGKGASTSTSSAGGTLSGLGKG